MDHYNPLQAPDPAEWLALEEGVRIELVQAWHEEAGEEVPESGEAAHAALHVVVENQLAEAVTPIPDVIARLLRQGLDRHDAVHAVAAVLSEGLHAQMQGEEAAWNITRYRRRLEKLTAKRWRKGQW